MLTEHFIPVADDVSRLQRSDDAEGRFFRHVAVQGHMKGRSRPEVSHQGIYAFAPDGTSLASANPLEAERTLALLEEALRRWAEYDERPDLARAHALGHAEPQALGYPEPGGAVLRMTSRDLPRPAGSPVPEDQVRYATQWNFDHIWLQPEDVRGFVPESFEPGAEREVPQALLSRIARFHLRDIVRGEPNVWGPGAVERFSLTSHVSKREGDLITLDLSGGVLLRERVTFQDSHKPIDWEFDNELDAVVAGDAVWNAADDRFERFDLVVAGQRSGAHRYNVRTRDPGPAPIGFAFELAGDEAWERTPPHALRSRGRRGASDVPVATTVTGESYYG